ncbi:MAG: GntR family transcriptional regulator [Burkholderiaceae bacterium]|nr:GntR family transcriptional regulator [Burkholderiaceae bacterium]
MVKSGMSGVDGPDAPRASKAAVYAPLYRQIKSLLLRSLQVGEWKPGQMIPSELELANRFQVSQGTVRKAIDELSTENLLIRKQGKGTFVATHHEPRARFRFLRVVPDDRAPVPAVSRYLECKRVRAPREVGMQLALKPSDPLVYLRRLLTFEGSPVVLDEIWLPGQLFKKLTAERLAEYNGPLYGLFESEFGTRMIRADERIRAVAAAADAARLLKVAAGSPLLLVERVSYTYGERPVEVRRGLSVTEEYHYRNTLT